MESSSKIVAHSKRRKVLSPSIYYLLPLIDGTFAFEGIAIVGIFENEEKKVAETERRASIRKKLSKKTLSLEFKLRL